MIQLAERYISLPYFFLENILGKLSRNHKSFFVTALAILLAVIYFSKLLLAPADYIFAKEGDDLKNYYTLKTYISQPVNKDILHYNSMNYPYRDIVYYSDNTPLLSMPLKWLSIHTGVSVNPIPVFNILVILNLVIASLLCYLLLSKFITSNSLAIILSISLPYFEPQAGRLIAGTENLGFSSIILANLLLLYIIYQRIESHKRLWPYLLLNYLLIVLSSFVHLYYLIILCLNTGLILSAYLILQAVRKQLSLNTVVAAILTPLLAFLTTFCIYLGTDEFYHLRNETAMGYNVSAWKLSIAGLFTSHPYMKTRFLFETTNYISYESHIYLGAFMLYGISIFIVFHFFAGGLIQTIKGYFRQPSAVFTLLVSAAAVVCFFIAIGPYYYIANDEYRIKNVLDLFSFIKLFTNRVEHFRCIGRFGWLFFWAANLCFAFILNSWLQTKNVIAIITVYVLSVLAINDMTSTGEEYRRTIYENKLQPQNMPTEVTQLNALIEKNNYDAILPLPFFLVGSEVHNRTIDPPNYDYFTFYFQLSSLSNLPLMSSMLSRTPLPSNESLFNFFMTSKMDDGLKEKLKGKKVAVILNNPAYNMRGSVVPQDTEDLVRAFHNSQTLPQQLQMTPVDTIGEYMVYEWRP